MFGLLVQLGIGFTVLVILLMLCVATVPQSTVIVITLFGKYRRVMRAGLNFKWPWESKFKGITLQNQTFSVSFQSITSDKATVNFDATFILKVLSDSEADVKAATFTFSSDEGLMMAITRNLESEVRSLIAKSEQSDVLGMKDEISLKVNEKLDSVTQKWGYDLVSFNITDMSFSAAVTESMEAVVAASNLRLSAENKGQALLIEETKKAEAEGNAAVIKAGAEAEARRLQGLGVANFRKAIADGIRESSASLQADGIDPVVLLALQYMDTMVDVAKNGKGKVLFMNGSSSAVDEIVKGIHASVDSGAYIPAEE